MPTSLNFRVNGKGQAFLCQHGLGSHLNQTQNLFSELKGVQLISADCPGHGYTPLPTNQRPSFNYYVDELNQLLDDLKVKKAIFGGISMGAGISINFALRYPEKVKGLVLIRPAWLDKGTPKNLTFLLKAAKYIGQPEGKKKFEKQEKYQHIQQILPKAAQSILGVFAETQRKEIPFVLESMIKDCPFPNFKALNKIDKPCLIIGNTDDPLHPYEMAIFLQQAIKESVLKQVPSRYVDADRHKALVTQLVSDFLMS